MIHILFPTDLSHESGKKLDYINELSKYIPVKLSLLHVYRDTTSPRRYSTEEGSIHQIFLNRLSEFSSKYLQDHSIRKLRYVVKEGSTVNELNDMSKEKRFDLIIMGIDQKFLWMGRLFGTRTTRTAIEAHCPVIVLPDDQTYDVVPKIIEVHLSAGNKRMSIPKDVRDIHLFRLNDSERVHIDLLIKGNPIRSYLKLRKKIKRSIDDGKKHLVVLYRKKQNLFRNLLFDLFTRLLLLDLKFPVLVFGKNVNIPQIEGIKKTDEMQLAAKKKTG